MPPVAPHTDTEPTPNVHRSAAPTPRAERSAAETSVSQPASDADHPARLRAVIGRLSRRLRPTAAGSHAGLTPTRVSVLLHVVRERSSRLAGLAEAEGINPTMLSRVVSDLVEAGLLERVSDERDRRAAWVKATAAGKRLAERIRRERTAALNAALAQLTDDHRARLLNALPALEALAEALKDRRP